MIQAPAVTIKTAYDELVSVILWIDEHSKEIDIDGDLRTLIAAACFDTVLEHQAAIAALVERQLLGSALALARVMAEAFIRGMWFARCATDEEATRFKNDEIKKLTSLVEEIEAKLGSATDTLSKMVKSQWATLCSFTHTGYKQVTRRYTGPLLKPNYPDAEVIQVLNFAGAIGLLAALELAALSKNLPLGTAIMERARCFASS
jgi:hypothetical protein